VQNEREKSAKALAERFWEELLVLEPLIGTYIGDDRYDDRLPDPSERGRGARETLFRGALADLERIDRSALDIDMRTTLDVLETGARRELRSIEHRIDRFDAVSHLFAGPGGLLATLASLQRADSPASLDKYVARLSAMPEYIDALITVAEEGMRVGQVSPALVVDRSIGQVERLVSIPPEESPGVTPVPESDATGRDRVAAVLRDRVWPAYGRYLELLRLYRGAARDSIGLSALPDGDAVYASQIWSYISVKMEAGDIHQLGQDVLAGIQEERARIAGALGHDNVASALAEYDATGKNRARSRQEMLGVVRDQVERSWEAAPRFFGRLPRANCEVRPVEEFREDDMPGAYYTGPTADGSRPGIYHVNTGQLDERPLHQVATTSYHEANPGHHFQISIEMEFTERMPLRRFGGFLVGDAFVEGWGLYSERLAEEMGLFLSDYERLGMLEAQAFRAGRLIVDTGIHALGWSREQSVRQMMDTGSTRADSEIEVDRYIADPGQALAYMIGKLEIDRWRREAAERRGPSFSTRDFHDRVLALGSLPLSALERELKASG
jgi:uncharacterized protein (DUF885 family)